MVKAIYEEPERGTFSLFCSCEIEPTSSRIVGVSVVPATRDGKPLPSADAQFPRFGLLTRVCNDAAWLVTQHLRLGVFPQALAEKMRCVPDGPATVSFPDRNPIMFVFGVSSPVQAIVAACAVAQEDWRTKTAQLAQEGVVGHA